MWHKNLVGEKFLRLTVINYSHHIYKIRKQDGRKYKVKYWRCLCICGNEKIVEQFDLLSGDTRSCGCLFKETHTKIVDDNIPHNRLNPGEASFNALLASYKRNAKKRNREFLITKEQFKLLTSSNCHYCGAKPSRKYAASHSFGFYLYNGIDRRDNSIGYTKGNCVTCCGFCNKLKSNLLTQDEMRDIIKLLKKSRGCDEVWEGYDFFGKYLIDAPGTK